MIARKFKQVLAVLLVAATFGMAQAQDISIGGKLGYNFATMSSPDVVDAVTPDFKTTSTTLFGVVAEVGINEWLSFQPELDFVKKGFKIKEGLDIDLFDFELPVGGQAHTQFSYVDVPLLAKLKFGTEGFGGFVTVGPNIGYALNGKVKTEANLIITDINTGKYDLDLDNINYERFEIGASLGAGLQYVTSGGKFFAEARYQHGFTQVYDIPVVNDQVQNRGVSLSIGYMKTL